MLDYNVLVGSVTAGIAVITAAGSTGLIIWHGGRQVGKVDAAISRLAGIEQKLEKIPLLEAKVEINENLITRMRSDHKTLAARVDNQIEQTAEIRGKLESVHD